MQNNSSSQDKLIFRGEQVSCTLDVTLAIVGGKWKTAILWHLKQKTMRFSDLQRKFPSTTRKMLTKQLRELESDGIVYRKVYPEVPPKVEYSLTERGRTIIPVLDMMHAWGKDFLEN
jgi:DNA-binding HxlR family transcriptional regulator